MKQLPIFIYQLIIQVYGLGIRFLAFFSPKARLWVNGRKRIFEQLEVAFQSVEAPIIWIHCASLGEFEQGRPLIEYFKTTHANYKILLTFFSPSGYEIRKNYPLADYVFYLPLDSPKNAHRFLNIIQPKLVFFVKYEFWYFYLNALQQKKIPHYLIAGVFRKEQFFLKKYARWYLEVIRGFNHLFLQDEKSQAILQSVGFTNYSIAGDPRIDRVAAMAIQPAPIPIVQQFKQHRKLLILGSTHSKDLQIFKDFLKAISAKSYYSDWCFLIAPHEIEPSNIEQIENLSPKNTYRFSSKDTRNLSPETTIFILDTIGQLSRAYQYADAVFIGGGFDKNIHNILEPAVFGVPIGIGPNYHRFTEAVELIERGGVEVIHLSKDFLSWFEQLQQIEIRTSTGLSCKNYIQQNKGSTLIIINYLNKINIL